MDNKITIFAMTEKGFAVLEAIFLKFPNVVQTVVGSTDKKIQKDFYTEIKLLCQKYNVEFIDRKDFKTINTEYAIAVSWRWIINIELNKTQLIIFHDSLLPRYRGFNPLVSALINGDTEIGVTALFATSTYDTGNIIKQSSTLIKYPIKIQEVIKKITYNYQEIALFIVEQIKENKTILSEKQNEQNATYSLWRDEEDYLIDWKQSSEFIERFINSVSFPYKGASTRFDERLVRILNAESIPDVSIENRVCGKVIFIQDSIPVVVCGKGLLKIKEMIDDKTQVSLIPLPHFRVRFY